MLGRRFGALVLWFAVALAWLPSEAVAQVAGAGTVYKNFDGNGVDLTSGQYTTAVPVGSIGAGDSALSLTNYFGQSYGDNLQMNFQRTESGANVTFTVTTGSSVETFTGAKTGTSFASTQGTGATLTKVSTEAYTLTTADGSVMTIAWPDGFSYQNGSAVYCAAKTQASCVLLIKSVVSPSGRRLTITWRAGENCGNEKYAPGTGEPYHDCAQFFRPESVANNAGYSISYSYANNTDPTSGLPPFSWVQKTGATFSSASASVSATFAYPSTGVTDITDIGGRTTRVTNSGSGYTVRLPGSSADDVTVTSPSGAVTQVVASGVTTTYARSVSGTVGTVTATDANGGQRVVISDLTLGRPTSSKDELNRTTSFTYDTNGRPKRTTAPEGNYVENTYDARGNVTATAVVGKGGAGTITTSAVYPSTCTSTITCNKPTSTTDARSNVTIYAYDPTHGGITSVTAPVPVTGAVQPQTRYTYTLTSGVYLPTGVSACQTTASCAGAADEVKTTIAYNANLLPSSVSTGAGNGSLTATSTVTYDGYGNVLTVDGPLPGTTDTVRFRYDAARQRVGTVTPDPDAGGALKNRAQRVTYNSKGQVTAVEVGTVNSQSDADWAAFATLQTTSVGYDTNARKVLATLAVSGTTYAAIQYSYDTLGRSDCVAQRMNPSVFGSLPGACSLGTTGSFGPDRITKTLYDAASETTQVQTAYATALQRTDSTYTYTANGKLQTLADGKGNKTTYVYDAFDRLSQTQYPSPTSVGSSNASDYEQLGYDAGSNVTSLRKRSGDTFGFTYDALNRQTLKDVPGGTASDVYYGYDNLGRQLWARYASVSGGGTTNTFDALGRLTDAVPNFGTLPVIREMHYQYDLAGRRTRMWWWDANSYVTYDYDAANEMTAIRLLGAASGTGVLATFTYDDLGRRTALNRGNGTTTTYGYDPVSRLTQLTQDLAGTVRDLTVTLGSYNPAGQIGSRSRSNDAYAWTQAYNVNRNYTTNGLNQLTVSGASTLGYDTRGNLTSDGTATFAYDLENRLTGIVSGGYGTFAYDPLGRLVGTCCGAAGDVTWGYDGDHLAIKTANSNGGPLERYVFGPNGDEPLVIFMGGDTSIPRWLHADERGSIVAISDASGTTLGTNAFDDYGIPQNPMGGSATMGPFGYTGQMWVPEAGVYNYKARFYSPTLGRFMQTDPIGYGDGNNWYNYVRSDPVNGSDPNGTCAKAISGCGGGDPYFGVVIGTASSGSRVVPTKNGVPTGEAYRGRSGGPEGFYEVGADDNGPVDATVTGHKAIIDPFNEYGSFNSTNITEISLNKFLLCGTRLTSPCAEYLSYSTAYTSISSKHFGGSSKSYFLPAFQNRASISKLYINAYSNAVPIPFGSTPGVFSLTTQYSSFVGVSRDLGLTRVYTFIIFKIDVNEDGLNVYAPSNGYPGLPK